MSHVERRVQPDAVSGPTEAGYVEDLSLAAPDPNAVASQIIASFEKKVNDINSQPAILDLGDVTTYAELEQMEKQVKAEESKLDKMEALLSEQEALGDQATGEKPNLRDLINRSKADTAEFKKQLQEYKKSFDPEYTIEGQEPVKPKGNVFLYPSLTTTIFESMMELAKQKILNKDLERGLKINMMATAWEWAQDAAAAAIAKGEAKKAQLICDGVTSLLTGCLHILSGCMTLRNYAAIKRDMDANFPQGTIEEKRVYQETLSRRLQFDPSVTTWQMIDRAMPQFLNSINSFVKTKFTMDEARADAAQVVANALKEMCDRMYQSAHDAFQSESQQIDAIKQFLDQFAQATTRILKG